VKASNNLANRVSYQNIAKYDTKDDQWLFIEPLTSANFVESPAVLSLAVAGSMLYAGGIFTRVRVRWRFEKRFQAGNLSVTNIAGATADGIWTDDLNSGIPAPPSYKIYGLLYASNGGLYFIYELTSSK
jgi:hypothetical protein